MCSLSTSTQKFTHVLQSVNGRQRNIEFRRKSVHVILCGPEVTLADKGGSSPPGGPGGLQPAERWTVPYFATVKCGGGLNSLFLSSLVLFAAAEPARPRR
jgi:hypothetical protein